MKRLLFTSLLWMGLTAASLPVAGQETLSQPRPAGVVPKPVIYLDVHASTWRPRGRVSFGIIPLLKMKLVAAGFPATQDPESPHDLTLRVEYREHRGKPISITLSGTEITCDLVLEHPQQGPLFSLSIHESPQYAEMVTAPYVEVMEQFYVNPYFYFLGDLIRGRIDAHLDPTGALIQAIDRQFDRERHPRIPTPLDTLESPAETFPDLDLHFSTWARENAIAELGRLKDPRAIDLLERLMFHEDWRIRLRAVLALGEFDEPSIAPAMTRVVQTDSDTSVRDAAATVLARHARP